MPLLNVTNLAMLGREWTRMTVPLSLAVANNNPSWLMAMAAMPPLWAVTLLTVCRERESKR